MDKNPNFKNNPQTEMNNPNKFQPTNDLSRFGHSVTLRKKIFY